MRRTAVRALAIAFANCRRCLIDGHVLNVFSISRACQGTELPLIRLKGMTWQSRRAVDPLVAAFPHFVQPIPASTSNGPRARSRGSSSSRWSSWPGDYDLIILDHPFMGDAARKGYLLSLDEVITGKDSDYVGPSLATYRLDGTYLCRACRCRLPGRGVPARPDGSDRRSQRRAHGAKFWNSDRRLNVRASVSRSAFPASTA